MRNCDLLYALELSAIILSLLLPCSQGTIDSHAHYRMHKIAQNSLINNRCHLLRNYKDLIWTKNLFQAIHVGLFGQAHQKKKLQSPKVG